MKVCRKKLSSMTKDEARMLHKQILSEINWSKIFMHHGISTLRSEALKVLKFQTAH